MPWPGSPLRPLHHKTLNGQPRRAQRIQRRLIRLPSGAFGAPWLTVLCGACGVVGASPAFGGRAMQVTGCDAALPRDDGPVDASPARTRATAARPGDGARPTRGERRVLG